MNQEDMDVRLQELSSLIDNILNPAGLKIGWILMVLPVGVETNESIMMPTGAISNGPKEWVIELLKVHLKGLESGEFFPPTEGPLQ